MRNFVTVSGLAEDGFSVRMTRTVKSAACVVRLTGVANQSSKMSKACSASEQTTATTTRRSRGLGFMLIKNPRILSFPRFCVGMCFLHQPSMTKGQGIFLEIRLSTVVDL